MRTSAVIISLAILTLLGSPATARPNLKRLGSTLAKPFNSRPARFVGRAVARPFKSKPARMIGKGIGKVLTFDRALTSKARKLAASSRRRRATTYDRQVASFSGDTAKALQIGKRSSKHVVLNGEQLMKLQQTTIPLLAGMKAVAVKVTDPVTGHRRKLERADLANALRLVRSAGQVLGQQRSVSIAPEKLSLERILAEPQISAAMLNKVSPANRAEFQQRYRAALSTLKALSQAYSIHLHWPGVLTPSSRASKGLASMARGLGGEASLVGVAVRRRTPEPLVEATRILTHKHHGGITHLWLDPLMAGKAGVAERIKAKLPDAESRKLVDQLVKFRDSGAVKVVAVSAKGKRDRKLEKKVHASLKPLSADAARKVIRSDFYMGASEGTKESFTRTVAIGSGLGFAMDGLAEMTNNPGIHRWKPTVLGGWDDAVGGALNVKEIRDVAKKTGNVSHGKKAILDGAISIGVGIGTSAALVAPLLQGGKSVAKLMLDPSTGLASRMMAGGIFGVASSGATMTMSFLPARHYRKPIIKLVEDGKISHPTDKNGLPLNGRALRRWASKQALKTHLSYTTQKGGLIGVGLSGVITAGFGIIPGLGGAALANVLLGIGGAGETLTTGAYLFAREGLDRRAIDKSAEKYLISAGR